MTENMKKGDLVWIPQSVRLHWYKEDEENFRYLITDEPTTAVVWDEKDNSYDVYMRGAVWTVNKESTYYVENR